MKEGLRNLGIQSFEFLLPATAAEADLIDIIDACNERSDAHYAMKMPLPKHLMIKKRRSYFTDKDVEGSSFNKSDDY